MAVLVLIYAFAALLLHTHQCIETDCSVCALIGSFRHIWVGIVLSAGLFPLARAQIVLPNISPDTGSVRDATPVGLKVKLSN